MAKKITEKRIYVMSECVYEYENEAIPNEVIKIMTVRFKDKKNKCNYWWIPSWKSIRELYNEAYATEVNNKGRNEELFVETAFKIIKAELKRCNISSDKEELINKLETEILNCHAWELATPIIYKNFNPASARLHHSKLLE